MSGPAGYIAHEGLTTSDTAYRCERDLVLGLLGSMIHGGEPITARTARRDLAGLIACCAGVHGTQAEALAAWRADREADGEHVGADEPPVYVIRPADLVEAWERVAPARAVASCAAPRPPRAWG